MGLFKALCHSKLSVLLERSLPDRAGSTLTHIQTQTDIHTHTCSIQYTYITASYDWSVTTVDVGKVLLRVNISKAAGLQHIPGHVLKACQSAGETVPSCLKTAIIVPLSMKRKNILASLDHHQYAFSPAQHPYKLTREADWKT